MAITAEPEILSPPRRRAATPFSDENLDLLSHLLDDFIRIPGTPVRFGLDGIVGFIPGIGDVLGGMASCILILAACVRGVPKVTIARMVLNVAIETGVGSLPLVGDLFDIWFRANRRNYALMTQSLTGPARRAAVDWVFIALVLMIMLTLVLLPVLLLGWVLVQARTWLLGSAR